jgi:putative transcriptional regulator
VPAQIGNEIRRLRFEHDQMTQQEPAEQAGCAHQTIILVEQGRYVPSLSLAFRINSVFDGMVEEVLGFDDE